LAHNLVGDRPEVQLLSRAQKLKKLYGYKKETIRQTSVRRVQKHQLLRPQVKGGRGKIGAVKILQI